MFTLYFIKISFIFVNSIISLGKIFKFYLYVFTSISNPELLFFSWVAFNSKDFLTNSSKVGMKNSLSIICGRLRAGWRTFSFLNYSRVNSLTHHSACGNSPNSFRSFTVFLSWNYGKNPILVKGPKKRSWKTITSSSFVSKTSNSTKSDVNRPYSKAYIVFYGKISDLPLWLIIFGFFIFLRYKLIKII